MPLWPGRGRGQLPPAGGGTWRWHHDTPQAPHAPHYHALTCGAPKSTLRGGLPSRGLTHPPSQPGHPLPPPPPHTHSPLRPPPGNNLERPMTIRALPGYTTTAPGPHQWPEQGLSPPPTCAGWLGRELPPRHPPPLESNVPWVPSQHDPARFRLDQGWDWASLYTKPAIAGPPLLPRGPTSLWPITMAPGTRLFGHRRAHSSQPTVYAYNGTAHGPPSRLWPPRSAPSSPTTYLCPLTPLTPTHPLALVCMLTSTFPLPSTCLHPNSHPYPLATSGCEQDVRQAHPQHVRLEGAP